MLVQVLKSKQFNFSCILMCTNISSCKVAVFFPSQIKYFFTKKVSVRLKWCLNWNPISRSIVNLLFNKDLPICCRFEDEIIRCLILSDLVCPNQKAKFLEKSHFKKAFKIYLGASLLYLDAPDWFLLDKPNAIL